MNKVVNRSKNLILKTVLSVGISLLFIIYIIWNRHSIVGALKNLSFGYVLLVVLGQIGIQLFNALLLRSTLQPLGKSIEAIESFKLTTVASFINFFTPIVGGAGARAVYLKKRHSLNYTTFISVMYANYLIIFLVSFLIGLLGLLAIPGAIGHSAGRVVGLFFGAGIVVSAAFMLAGHRATRVLHGAKFGNQRITGILKKIELVGNGWDAIRRDTMAILSMAVWSAGTMLSVVLVYWAAMKSIGLDPSLGISVMFAALALVGLLLNLTPGSIGVRESVFAAVTSITAISAQQVIAFSLVDRTVQLLVLGASWLLFNRAVLYKAKNT